MALSTPHARPWSPARVPYRNTQIVSGLQVGEPVVTGTSSSASSRSGSASGSGNVFGFGPPGGGNNRQGGQGRQQRGPGGQG